LQQKKPHHRENINIFAKFPRVYFVTVMIGYIGGLVATAVAMHLMNAAQPALLYLVPGTTAPVFLVAAIRGHLPEMFKYVEDDKEEEAKEAPEEKVAQTKKETKKSK
jgi:minor histocompatibility antigen H13